MSRGNEEIGGEKKKNKKITQSNCWRIPPLPLNENNPFSLPPFIYDPFSLPPALFFFFPPPSDEFPPSSRNTI